jgi:hypothetical protein
MATDTIEPSDLLSRLDMPMTPAAAESVLLWKFTDQAVDKMDELAEKARQGTLTVQEQAAVDLFERTNNMLGILKSRARQLLNAAPDSSAS